MSSSPNNSTSPLKQISDQVVVQKYASHATGPAQVPATVPTLTPAVAMTPSSILNRNGSNSPQRQTKSFTEIRTASPRAGVTTMPPQGLVMREVMAISQRKTPKSGESEPAPRVTSIPKRFSFITNNLFGPEADATDDATGAYRNVGARSVSCPSFPTADVVDLLTISEKSGE